MTGWFATGIGPLKNKMSEIKLPEFRHPVRRRFQILLTQKRALITINICYIGTTLEMWIFPYYLHRIRHEKFSDETFYICIFCTCIILIIWIYSVVSVLRKPTLID